MRQKNLVDGDKEQLGGLDVHPPETELVCLGASGWVSVRKPQSQLMKSDEKFTLISHLYDLYLHTAYVSFPTTSGSGPK